jgi:hypothetical protein
MRNYKAIAKWLAVLTFVPFALLATGCSPCTSCTVAKASTPASVTASIPICGSANVAVNGKITATFSEAMDPASINAGSFTVNGPGTTQVAGTVTYDATSRVATFSPTANLAFNTLFSVAVSSAAKSALGVSSTGTSACSFTTTADPVPPTVLSLAPSCGVTSVPIGTKITVAFSKPMDPATITSSTFLVTGPSTTPIAGAVTYNAANNTAQFTPSAALPPNTLVTVTITTGAKSSTGTAIASSFSCSFTTAATVVPVPPTVTALSPTCGATGVQTNQKIAVTFSAAMDPATMTAANITVTGPGATPIAGVVTYAVASNIATFTPSAALPANTLITVTVTTGAKDLAGTAMAAAFTCGFTTALAPDTTAPTVISTNPSCGATGVALNSKVAAIFSEAMDPLTITSTTFTVTGPGTTAVAGTVAYSGTGNTATFTPTSALAANTVFTITVTTGAKDLAGNALAASFVCSFTTGPAADTTPPTVILSNPSCGATGVATNTTVNTTFSEPMDPLTITTANLLLTGPGTTSVQGVVVYNAVSRIATFTPVSALAASTLYTFTVSTGVRDLAGNAMAANYVCTFTTAAGPGVGPAPVDLKSAAGFVILAGSTVTNIGLTKVNGDLGLSPGTAVTGFPPGVVNGTQHVADPIAAQAKLDLTTAFNDAAGRSLNVIIVATGELGGLTLAPGLYRSGISSFAITSADLTLDAQGNPNAVWIFQMPSSTLTVGNGRKVILAGGATAANIFWSVGTSATLGTTSVVQGTIMADQSITLNTGAVLNGRALARIAAVTLDTNIVTKP